MSGRPSDPARPPAPPSDEVSLRDLYLVLARGLPLILVVTVVAAVAAGAVVLLQPDVYEAEATVVSAPTRVQIREQGTLAFEPRSAIAFATYEDIALSRATFEAAIARLDEAGGPAPDGVQALESAVRVERLAGPDAADGTPLTVVHRVAWTDPARAATFADAWAEATVAQVRSTLLADLEPARAQTMQSLEQREAALAEAEAAYRAFQAQDLPGVERELDTVTERAADAEDAIAALDRQAARLDAQRSALLLQVDAEAGAAADAGALELLADGGRLDPETAAQLRGAAGNERSVIGLLAQADLQQVVVTLAGIEREREQLAAALAASQERAEALRQRIADLRQEEARLTRRLRTAENAYRSLQAIEPALAFVADLTPGNTRVLNAAQEPTDASGPSLLWTVAVAAVAAFLAATLFVFLREAVRDPAAAASRPTP